MFSPFDRNWPGRVIVGLAAIISLLCPSLSATGQEYFSETIHGTLDSRDHRIDVTIFASDFTDIGQYQDLADEVASSLLDSEPFCRYVDCFNIHRFDTPQIATLALATGHPQADIVQLHQVLEQSGYPADLVVVLIDGVSKGTGITKEILLRQGIDKWQALENIREMFYSSPEAPPLTEELWNEVWERSAGIALVGCEGSNTFDLAIHEIGHAFASLEDEYDHSPPDFGHGPVAIDFDIESAPVKNLVELTPQEAAISENYPWSSWIAPDTNLPTDDTAANGLVGGFPGGAYRGTSPADNPEGKYVYRPESDCRMKTYTKEFCKVCLDAITETIHTHPDTAFPAGTRWRLRGKDDDDAFGYSISHEAYRLDENHPYHDYILVGVPNRYGRDPGEVHLYDGGKLLRREGGELLFSKVDPLDTDDHFNTNYGAWVNLERDDFPLTLQDSSGNEYTDLGFNAFIGSEGRFCGLACILTGVGFYHLWDTIDHAGQINFMLKSTAATDRLPWIGFASEFIDYTDQTGTHCKYIAVSEPFFDQLFLYDRQRMAQEHFSTPGDLHEISADDRNCLLNHYTVEGSGFGWSLASLHRQDDVCLFVGDYNATDSSGRRNGLVYRLSVNAIADGMAFEDAQVKEAFEGDADGTNFGSSMDTLPQILAVGAPSIYSDHVGKAYIFYLDPGLDSSRVHRFSEMNPGEDFGRSVQLIENGGGAGNHYLAVGAPYADHAGENSGSVYIFSLEYERLIRRIDGAEEGQKFGSCIEVAGDMDHGPASSAIPELLISGPYGRGSVYCISVQEDPDITGVQPLVGSIGGGDQITILGENFPTAGEALEIELGQASVTDYEIISESEISLITPPSPDGKARTVQIVMVHKTPGTGGGMFTEPLFTYGFASEYSIDTSSGTFIVRYEDETEPGEVSITFHDDDVVDLPAGVRLAGESAVFSIDSTVEHTGEVVVTIPYGRQGTPVVDKFIRLLHFVGGTPDTDQQQSLDGPCLDPGDPSRLGRCRVGQYSDPLGNVTIFTDTNHDNLNGRVQSPEFFAIVVPTMEP